MKREIIMENFDNHHIAKRQRTDGDTAGQRGAYYNNFNNQQRQSRGGGGGGGGGSGGSSGDEEKTNHILLMTILNPAYPITVDVIHTISSSSGQVLRIVIFKKNGVQAMVEFEDLESAKRAKHMLHGADIYSGCCTLKIEYAKPTRLNVYKNDSDSWDYTNPSGKPAERPGPLLQEPRFGGAPIPYRGEPVRSAPPAVGYNPPDHNNDHYDGYGGGRGGSGYGVGGYGGQPEHHYGAVSHDRFAAHHDRYSGRDNFDARMDGPPGPPPRGVGAGGGGGGGGVFQIPSHVNNSGASGGQPIVPQQGSVVMVYGLNHEKVNGDRIFNLFCLYGNVVRVKFLKSKEGCAMVQMGDGSSVERVVRNLNNAFFFNNKMQLGFSKQAFLNDVQLPYELPDGTPSFKDYMGNRNNRFTNPESAGKNRIQSPSKMLHFFNTPFGITEEDMKKVFEGHVTPPISVKVFASKNAAAERSSSGLLEWESTAEALEALIICNHTHIPNPKGKFPYVLKLCFSSSMNTRNHHQ